MKKLLGAIVLGSLLVFSFSGIARPSWEGKLGAGISAMDGNDDNVLGTISVEANRATLTNNLKLKVEYSYGEEDNVKDSEKLEVSSKFRQDISPNTYWALGGEITRDYSKDLEREMIVTLGLGYKYIKYEDAEFYIEGGGSYIVTKYDDMPVDDDGSVYAEEGFNISLSEGTTLSHKGVYFPDIEDKDDYKLVGEIALETKMTDNLSFRVTLKDEYDNLPEAGRERNDMTVLSQIVCTFK